MWTPEYSRFREGPEAHLQRVRCPRSLRLHAVDQVREDAGEGRHADAGAHQQQHFELLQGMN